ncbi:MAG: hypothetical protein R2685_13705 [Candidatus Nitrosocosmicus sp.]|nr:hypothetical protein [Candidatus Nitrosocosmicus sp.]
MTAFLYEKFSSTSTSLTANYAKCYKYDPLIEDAITSILYVYGELPSNKLRRDIQEMVSLYDDKMRKSRREKDKNKTYTPSPAKVSATINQLLKWRWLERRELMNKKTDKDNDKLKGLPKVLYSLSQEARFVTDIGISANQDFQLEDAFHLVVSSATIGWDYVRRDEKSKRAKIITIEGTTVIEMLNRRDHYNITLHKYPRYPGFTEPEIQRAIDIALEKGIIQKKIIDDDIKYIIIDNLREFISLCWRSLFVKTRTLVRNMFVLKRLLKKSNEYQIFISWLSKFQDDDQIRDFLINCNDSRKRYTKAERQELLQTIKKQLAEVNEQKSKAIAIYENIRHQKDLQKISNLKEAVFRYTCPENILNSINTIIDSERN